MKTKKIEQIWIAYQNETYEVTIRYKKMRNIVYRLDDHHVNVSAPMHLNSADIQKRLETYFPKIHQKLSVKQAPIGEGYTYLFGKKFEQKSALSENELKQKLRQYIEPRVATFQQHMHISTKYSVVIRNMKTRFGTNSRKTNTLYFTTKLVHFSPDIIDSVIIHELAHFFHFDHQAGFYEILLHYCPEYWTLHRKLTKGVYTS